MLPDPDCDHVWNSVIGQPPRVIECDWCVKCSVVRLGYMDPREKWKEDKS